MSIVDKNKPMPKLVFACTHLHDVWLRESRRMVHHVTYSIGVVGCLLIGIIRDIYRDWGTSYDDETRIGLAYANVISVIQSRVM